MNKFEYKIDHLADEMNENYVAEEDNNEGEVLEQRIKYKDYDPVRLYLKEMSSLPLLSREEELYLAKKIKITSRLLHRRVLGFDYALEKYVRILEELDSESDLVQFVETAVTKEQSKNETVEQLHCVAEKIKDALEKNLKDYEKMNKGIVSKNLKSRVLRKAASRKRKAIKELEAMHIRAETILPVMKELLSVLSEVVSYKESPQGSHYKKEVYKKLLHDSSETKILLMETVEATKKAIHSMNSIYHEYESARNRFSEGNLRLVVSIAKKVQEARHGLPRSYSGRKHGSDAGC